MDRDAIFAALRKAEPEFKNRGIQSLAVFGSVARGNYSQDSDLDILVDFSRPIGLFDFLRIKFFLEQITHCRVDLVTPDALRPEMKDTILREAVHVR